MTQHGCQLRMSFKRRRRLHGENNQLIPSQNIGKEMERHLVQFGKMKNWFQPLKRDAAPPCDRFHSQPDSS